MSYLTLGDVPYCFGEEKYYLKPNLKNICERCGLRPQCYRKINAYSKFDKK